MDKMHVWALIIGIVVLAVLVIALTGEKEDIVTTCFVDNGTKEYLGLSQEQCSAMRFGCDEGEEYFADACGCGCIPVSDNGKKVPVYCTNESRDVEACTKEYMPVCGYFDPSNVQCVTEPCAITAGNKCEVCQNPNVLYYVEGMCPDFNNS